MSCTPCAKRRERIMKAAAATRAVVARGVGKLIPKVKPNADK